MSYTPLFSDGQRPAFRDRTQAGKLLAQAIHETLTRIALVGVKSVPIVCALPRGGLPVAAPIARLLGCPLTIEVAKKITHPQNPELAIGAVTASENVLWADQKFQRSLHNSRWQEAALHTAIEQAKTLEAQLSPACPKVNVEGATVILVDDGIATGMTIAVAVVALRKLSPAAIWLCTPVAPLKLLPILSEWGDRVIALETPESFSSVSNFYYSFPQVDTQEAFTYLKEQGIES
ncbi:MAG: phosphoribosyltransferase [Cyanomargarita calcarea GSE-NOS-MK-12-04C]|jgi:predicted phosphoribosyltransferase|uniref:Phosphoribosyltransferase n=1 Tax=Cyanomargarita calcarea GSE-NOS-MK-12-04C TaxID=2839659 RepID=A0A951UW93_9CYAN|nr:phosphoribosyltransferase [Cyanomargarita calcarea GSE-NOS-MK-12-04C]